MKIKVNDVNEASWRDMQVKSNLPENLRKLEEIAYNLWWCWDSDARNLFRNIDRTAWKEASSNPIRLATVLPYKKLLELSEDKQFLERLYAIMEESLSQGELDVDTISAKLGYSRTKLFYKIKAIVGQTPNEFFTTYKLNKSLELLRSGKYKISAVAEMVGFSSASHFSNLFKKKFGMLPSQYRE